MKISTLDVVLVTTAMTFNSIVKLANTILHVLTSNAGERMLTAAIAGTAFVIVG